MRLVVGGVQLDESVRPASPWLLRRATCALVQLCVCPLACLPVRRKLAQGSGFYPSGFPSPLHARSTLLRQPYPLHEGEQAFACLGATKEIAFSQALYSLKIYTLLAQPANPFERPIGERSPKPT